MSIVLIAIQVSKSKTQTTKCRNNYPAGSISMTREMKWVENQVDKYQVDFMKA